MAPPGTLAPGTVVSVGAYTVTVDRFLSEGGFAHVYLATSPVPLPVGGPAANTQLVLKRIAVPDKPGVAEVGKEVEVMKLLRDHPRIVNFIEASFSELPATATRAKCYEIFILMEWCPGGGIIDMMNTRLQNRMTESEILKIFSDVVEAVAHMHYQSPPLIHRDLKVENILFCPPQSYKLCDFGSTTTPLLRIPTAVAEIQAMEADINKTTTLQYRAPELMDVWSRKGFDEKIDIWALGVFLYKLCYYTTPFEEAGPLAIINAQYKIPSYPAYSNDIKHMIGVLLQESASQRPNIFQVHERVCKMRGTAVKIENKYSKKALPLQPRRMSTVNSSSAYSSVLSTAPQAAANPTQNLNDSIAPMRRGRPVRAGGMTDSPVPSLVIPEPAPSPSRPMSSATLKSASRRAENGFGDSFMNSTNSGGIVPSPSFSDTFAPAPSPARSNFSSASALPPSAISRTGTPASASTLFADLLPAQRSGRGPSPVLSTKSMVETDWRISPSVSGPSSLSMSAARSNGADSNLGLHPSTSSSSLSSNAPFRPATVASPGKAVPSRFTGEMAPPAQPRPRLEDQPSSFRSSRSAQTSPRLMADWASTLSVVTPVAVPTLALSPRPPPPRDLLGDEDDFQPSPLPPSQPQPSSPLPTPHPAPRVSMMNHLTGETSNAPFRPTTPKTAAKPYGISAPLLSKTRMVELDASERFPALEDEGGERRSARESWTEIVEKEEEESSEDEMVPVGSPRASNGTTAQPVPSSSDAVPPFPSPKSIGAPASPILRAPQPQSLPRQAAISNLVSKYETLSITPTERVRPPPPAKPVGLRRSSTRSGSAGGMSLSDRMAQDALDGVQQKSAQVAPTVVVAPSTPERVDSSLPPRLADRLPFKPVAPPSPINSTRPLPKSATPMTPSRSNTTGAEEEDVPFAGVSSMVNRWQGISSAKPDVPPKRRKEFAVV